MTCSKKQTRWPGGPLTCLRCRGRAGSSKVPLASHSIQCLCENLCLPKRVKTCVSTCPDLPSTFLTSSPSLLTSACAPAPRRAPDWAPPVRLAAPAAGALRRRAPAAPAAAGPATKLRPQRCQGWAVEESRLACQTQGGLDMFFLRSR